MANTWIIAVEPEIAALVEHGRAVGGSVVAVTVGGTPVAGVDRVVDVPLAEGVPAEAAAPMGSPELAHTGTSALIFGLTSVLLVGAGAAALRIRRRRA